MGGRKSLVPEHMFAELKVKRGDSHLQAVDPLLRVSENAQPRDIAYPWRRKIFDGIPRLGLDGQDHIYVASYRPHSR